MSNQALEGLAPIDLRCEALVDPLGIDALPPRLSWKLESEKPGDVQTGYRILAASSPEKLAAGEGDLWDTGRVSSDETLWIEYAGKPLKSSEQVWWKLKVWDKAGHESVWSEPGHFSMGLLKPGDWQARWIAAPLPGPIQPPNYGFHSGWTEKADDIKWVQLDLGRACRLNKMVIFPAHPIFSHNRRQAMDYLFPVRFKIEAADRADFSDARVLVDHTGEDFPRPENKPVALSFPPTAARYLRLTVTQLASGADKFGLALTRFGLALAEWQVFSGADNVAHGAAVTASDTLPAGDEEGWSATCLTDGRLQPDGGDMLRLRPAPMFRKEFIVEKPVRRAVLSATALGVYVASMNGLRVSDHWFAPGWNQYDKRVRYQTYDVTKLLKQGGNVLSATLADGWYRQRRSLGGYSPEWNLEYGGSGYPGDGIARLIAQLDIEYADGSRAKVATDGSWQCHTNGPVRKTRMFDGVDYDARREMPGWDASGFSGKGWVAAGETEPLLPPVFSAQMNPPIRVIDVWQASNVQELRPGVFIYSFPQHVTGVCRLRIEAPEGTVITLRHGQGLNPDGSLFTGNLMAAAHNRDNYVCRGAGVETFVPEFTYHGFQHVELSGVSDPGAVRELTALALSDDITEAFHFESSDTRLNKLWRNIVRTYLDNSKSSTTDNAARDERAAFHLFSTWPTQVALFDSVAFARKQLEDIRDAQYASGEFAIHAPTEKGKGAAAMAAPNPINLWAPWLHYGDRRILEENYESFARLMKTIRQRNPDGLWKVHPGAHVNDWLDGYMSDAPGEKNNRLLWSLGKPHPYLPEVLTRSAHLYWLWQLMAQMATALGKSEDAAQYERYADETRASFCREFVKHDGTVTGDIQSSYALALGLDLIAEPSLREKAFAHLLQTIADYKGHISTGVRATLPLLQALSENGEHELAYKLVMQPEYPSYGFMVDQGATTVWERWDGFIPGRGYRSDLSHIEFPVVGQWIMETISGIRPDVAAPGYKHFIIAPQPPKDMEWVNAHYDSIRGRIECNYVIRDGICHFDLLVPPNTTASLGLPDGTRRELVSGRHKIEAMISKNS